MLSKENIAMSNQSNSTELFKTVTHDLEEIFTLPLESKDDQNKILARLEETAAKLDRIYLTISTEMNTISVIRAMIIGRICNYVKGQLLHGAWTNWAIDHFTEGLRSLEKFMAIATFELAIAGYAHLGTEKVYQLTRLVGRLEEEMTFEDACSITEQNTNFECYSCKEFERAINTIINSQTLKDLDIEIDNESLKALTENFNLIKNNTNLLTTLAQAAFEEANLEKTITNIVSNGGQKRSVKKKAGAPKKVEDVNHVAERFIASLQEAMYDSNTISSINTERVQFIARLIAEYCQIISQTKP